MLIYSTLSLLLSNSVTLRRDKSILYNRLVIFILLLVIYIAISTLSLNSLGRGLGLFGGLLHTTSTTQVFHIFIFFISAIILQLTAFYPRRVWIPEYSSLNKLILYKFVYYKNKIVNMMAEQFKIIEYPLILFYYI